MAKVLTAKLHGVDQIRSFVSSTVLTKRIGNALEETAKDISALARQIVQFKTGKLKRSIRARQVAPMIWQVRAGNRKAFYAHFVERGTVRSRAYPFLRPAFDAYRAKVTSRIGKAVMAGLRAGSKKRTKT
jgi:HK97 gp10 family phage protein